MKLYNRTVDELTKSNAELKDKAKLLDEEKVKATAATAAEVTKFTTEKVNRRPSVSR